MWGIAVMRVLSILVSGVLALMIGITALWCWKTLTIVRADEEVWIDLNTRMPRPMRDWACDQVKARTKAPTPPDGCAGHW